jgi:drug/metabolite transporter (DMT)-like permease
VVTTGLIRYDKAMTERYKALSAIVLCVLFWGLSFISIKAAGAVFPPMTMGALRFALAVILLLFIKKHGAPGEKLRRRDIPRLLGAGFTGVTLYFFCENNGVALVSASEASIIIGAIPVLTMTAEWLGDRLGRGARGKKAGEIPAGGLQGKALPSGRTAGMRWFGAVFSLAGVALVARVPAGNALLPEKLAGGSGNALGCLYMAGAALSWVVYSFLTRPLFSRASRIYIVFWQSVFGFLGFLPFAALEYPRWGRPDLPVLAHIVFLGICCSALGYWFYARSLEVLGVGVSSTFINFIPVVTVIAGFFILGERLRPVQWAGAALVLSGVYLAMTEPRRKKTSIPGSGRQFQIQD